MALPKIIQIPEGDEGALQWHYKRVEVSSAEILTLFSAPKELVEAPGAGKMAAPIHAICKYHFVTTPYDNVNDDIQINTEGAATYLIIFNNMLSRVADWRGVRSIRQLDIDQPENARIILTEDVDPTGGDSTLTVYLWYIILTL